MWLSIKERRHCLLDFPEKCSDDKFVHANAAQVGILWRKGILYRERDNGLDNKTVPSRFGRLHPFSFGQILKSRNRNFNPAHPNESLDVRDATLILEFRYWWAQNVKLFTNLTIGEIYGLIWRHTGHNRSGLRFSRESIPHLLHMCVSKTQWNGPPVRGQIYMGGQIYSGRSC